MWHIPRYSEADMEEAMIEAGCVEFELDKRPVRSKNKDGETLH
jgi:hypothetical protein